MKWPHSKRSSRLLAPAQVKEPALDYTQFEDNDSTLKLNLSGDLWNQLSNLGYHSDTSTEDAIRAVLFEAIYGKATLIALSDHAIKSARVAGENDRNDTDEGRGADVRPSRDRYTNVDVRHLGKPDTSRTIHLPRRLLADLENEARRSGLVLPDGMALDTPTYARALLFRSLRGEKAYAEWIKDRTFIA